MRNFLNKLIIAVFLLNVIGMDVMAAETLSVAGTYTDEQGISVYVKGITDDASEISCQIGTKAGQKITCERVEEMENQSKTLILVDNSLSITDNNRVKTISFIKDYIDDKNENEQVAIYTFSDETTLIIDFTEDKKQLKEAASSIEFQNQDTYLTDVLYDVIINNDMGSEDCYRKIIIISDGVDNKSIGYTKDELYTLIKDKKYPIYTLGCIYKENNEQLENLFALSRMTGGVSFLMDDVEDTGDPVDEIIDDSNAVRFIISPAQEELDGSNKNILITFRMGEEEQKIEAVVKMPLVAVDVVGENTPEPIAEVTAEPAEEAGIVDEEERVSLFPMFLCGTVLLLIILTVVAMLLISKSKKNRKVKNADRILPVDITSEGKAEEACEKTVILSDDEEKTQGIWENEVIQRNLYLVDIKCPDKQFKAPLNKNVIIGRKASEADIVLDYDKSVSGTHCEISEKNGKYFVKDLQSSNHTFLNGVEISGKTEVYSGCILTLGRVEMKLEIK